MFLLAFANHQKQIAWLSRRSVPPPSRYSCNGKARLWVRSPWFAESLSSSNLSRSNWSSAAKAQDGLVRLAVVKTFFAN